MASPRAVAVDDEPIGARLRRPDLARPAEDLAHGGSAAVAREHLERLRLGIEADHGVGAPVAEPHRVAVVHVDRVGARALAGQLPGPPAPARRVVPADVAGVPLSYPQPAPPNPPQP